MFWLLAVPLMAWTGPLLSFQAWAVRSVPLALATAPLVALAALGTAQHRRTADLLGPDGMDTPFAMLVIFGVSLLFALGGLVALRALRVGSLALSGVLVNGVFFAIVALLDLRAEDIGPP